MRSAVVYRIGRYLFVWILIVGAAPVAAEARDLHDLTAKLSRVGRGEVSRHEQPTVPYAKEIARAARRHGLPPSLVAAVCRAESNFITTARSRRGALGLMQLMPGTARELGVIDATQPSQNLDGGARYLRQQLDRFRSLRMALAAYNAGPTAVDQKRVPTETWEYVARVLDFATTYRRSEAQWNPMWSGSPD